MTNVTTLTFKGCQFQSNSMSPKTLDIPKLDFSLLLNLTTLKSLNFSHSNFLSAISDDQLETFCVRLQAHPIPLTYLGLASLMPTYSLNLRKYLYLLEHLSSSLDKLNLSYNLLLPQPLIDHVLYRV